MEVSTSVLIKREAEELDLDTDNYLGLDLDFKVEKSEESLLGDYDWCMQNETCTIENDQLISYEDLRDCKQECMRCNMIVEDSYSLLQHNLKHLNIILTPCDFFENSQIDDYDDIIYYPEDKIQSEVKKTIKPNSKATQVLYKCKMCNKTYNYKHWHAHIRQVHGEKKVVCNTCNKVFKCKQYLQRHIKYIHGDIKPSWRYHNVKVEQVICDVCSVKFHNKNSLVTHFRNCHSNSAVCSICKSKLKSKAYLHTHMLRVHYNDGKQHRCNVCNKNFKSPRYLKVHKKNSRH